MFSSDNTGDTMASHNVTALISPITFVSPIESSSAPHEYHINWFVLFIWFIWLVLFNQKPNRPEKPDRPGYGYSRLNSSITCPVISSPSSLYKVGPPFPLS